jgi:hypothetical protein
METRTEYRISIPLPELAVEAPTVRLTHAVYFGARSYWTVAALVALLVDGIGRMTDGDLERVERLGALAHEERCARERRER